MTEEMLNQLNEQVSRYAKRITELEAEIEALKKELALQRLSDIGQEIENRESAIYATGYWKGIAKGKENE